MAPDDKAYQEVLLTEYTAAQDAYLHYDGYSWQVGAVLIAGTFVFWGFLLSPTVDPALAVTGTCFVSLLMSFWYLYTHHCRQIYHMKLHRIHQIEERLNMEQHLGWTNKITGTDGKPRYRTYGPHGNALDLLIYLVTSIGSLFIACFKVASYFGFQLPSQLIQVGLPTGLLLLLVLILGVIRFVYKNEEKIQQYKKQM